MPRLLITLPDNTQSVSRPVIFSVIEQLQALTKIPADTKIFYPGEVTRMSTPGGTVDSNSRDAIFNTNRYTFIEVKEEYDLTTLGSTATRKKEHIPIFNDTNLNVQIVPVYSTTNVVISFKYRGNSETEVKRWYDDLRVRISELRDINLHTLQYHYPLSMEAILLLKEIYTKRELVAPYGDSLEDYIKSYSGTRLALISDLSGVSTSLVVQETQVRVVGLYDIDGLPAIPERDDATGTWSVSFDYKFSYEKPIEYCLQYPIIVHNQLLEPDYIDFSGTGYNLDYANKTAPLSLTAFHEFETTRQYDKVLKVDPVIRIPDFDDFIPKSVPMGTGSIMTVLAEVDRADATSLFNLAELGDLQLDLDVLEFIMYSEYPYICKFYKSIVQLQLYRNESLIESGSLECTSNLDVKTITQVNFRNNHRVRLALVTDLTLLDQDALDRLKKYPRAFIKIIGAINELLLNCPDFTDLGRKKRISEADFDAIYRLLTGEASLGSKGKEGLGALEPNAGILKFVKSNCIDNIPMNNRNNSDNNRRNPLSSYNANNNKLVSTSPYTLADFEWYRRNAKFSKSVMVSNIVSIHKE